MIILEDILEDILEIIVKNVTLKGVPLKDILLALNCLANDVADQDVCCEGSMGTLVHRVTAL